MKIAWILGIVGSACSTAWAQPGDRNSIDIMVRLAGEEQWSDDVEALPGQTVEVGVFYFRDRGYSFAGAVHNVIASNWDAAAGDTATIVDNPDSTLHPDGRVSAGVNFSGWNFGGQRQDIYTTGIDAGRMRISAFGNPSNIIAGGISPRQNSPIFQDFHVTGDGVLAYRFNITIGSDVGRTIPLDAPRADMAGYSVFLTEGSTAPTNILSLYDGTDQARIHIVPDPSTVVLLMAGASVIGRRRRSGAGSSMLPQGNSNPYGVIV